MKFEKVRDIIAKQLDLDAAAITPESRLIEDLHADSLDIVELVMDMEQEFDVEIPDELLPKIKTVGDIMQFLAENKNQPSTHGPASAGAGFFK